MLYNTYHLYDEGMEIMIPSNLELTDTFGSSQYSWLSKDRKTVVNVTRGGADLTVEEIDLRLNEYYKGFCRGIKQFEGQQIAKRMINGRSFGEIQYLSCVTGYCFSNIFLLGVDEGREVIVTIQCLEQEWEANARIFGLIADSLRWLKKRENQI